MKVSLREDVQAIIQAIASRSPKDVEIELSVGARADLSSANLSGLMMIEVDDPDGAEFVSRFLRWC